MALLAPSEYGCIPWHTGMVLEGENVVIMIAIVVDGDATVDGCCFAVDVNLALVAQSCVLIE